MTILKPSIVILPPLIGLEPASSDKLIFRLACAKRVVFGSKLFLTSPACCNSSFDIEWDLCDCCLDEENSTQDRREDRVEHGQHDSKITTSTQRVKPGQ